VTNRASPAMMTSVEANAEPVDLLSRLNIDHPYLVTKCSLCVLISLMRLSAIARLRRAYY
jgi:hypothetical protein